MTKVVKRTGIRARNRRKARTSKGKKKSKISNRKRLHERNPELLGEYSLSGLWFDIRCCAYNAIKMLHHALKQRFHFINLYDN